MDLCHKLSYKNVGETRQLPTKPHANTALASKPTRGGVQEDFPAWCGGENNQAGAGGDGHWNRVGMPSARAKTQEKKGRRATRPSRSAS